MSVEVTSRPSSLFGYEIDQDDTAFYNTLNEMSGRKSSLSFYDDFTSEDNIEIKFKSFLEKDATPLKSLNGNYFNFDTPNNIFNQYYEKRMDINAIWPLLNGKKIKSLIVHNTRYFFDELPCRFNFKDIKYQLDKSLINNKKYIPIPEKYYQDITNYYKWIINFCNDNCDVFPYKLNDQRIIFLPIISPLWFINGKIFKSVENYGYINPNSEYCVDWLADWLTKYNSDIKEKYIKANKLFSEKKIFIELDQIEDYKNKLISSSLTIIENSKFTNRFKEDIEFRKLNKVYFESIIKFLEIINNADLSNFNVFSDIIEKYIEIIKYNVIY